MIRKVDEAQIRRWRRRGFYSESVLVKLLLQNGYYAVRVPVSNQSMNPLPDVIARKKMEIYDFEVKNAKYYAYFPRSLIAKLFGFLAQSFPMDNLGYPGRYTQVDFLWKG